MGGYLRGTGTRTPEVSVLMPVRNGTAFVRTAIESILGQSFSDFGFIIVDDGSTDETPDILGRAGQSDHRIRVVSQAPRGIVVALEAARALARGPYLASTTSRNSIALRGHARRCGDALWGISARLRAG
jgi:glycosyltransferase involved in cell wall biosynthesis